MLRHASVGHLASKQPKLLNKIANRPTFTMVHRKRDTAHRTIGRRSAKPYLMLNHEQPWGALVVLLGARRQFASDSLDRRLLLPRRLKFLPYRSLLRRLVGKSLEVSRVARPSLSPIRLRDQRMYRNWCTLWLGKAAGLGYPRGERLLPRNPFGWSA